MSTLNRILQAAMTAAALTFSACAADQQETLPANNTSALVDATLNASPEGDESALIGRFNKATDHGRQINLLYEIHDQEFLKAIVTDSSMPDEVRAAACFNMTDQDFLLKTARNESSPLPIRIAALAQITGPKILEEFAKGSDEQLVETARRRLEQINP